MSSIDWVLDTGYWILDFRYWILDSGWGCWSFSCHSLSVAGFCSLNTVHWSLFTARRRGRRDWFFLFSVDPAEKAGLAGKRETTNSSPTGYKWIPKDMCFSDVFKHPGEIETEVISFPLRTLRGEIPICTGWNFVNGYGIWNSWIILQEIERMGLAS